MTTFERIVLAQRSDLEARLSDARERLKVWSRFTHGALSRRADGERAKIALYLDLMEVLERHERAPKMDAA